MEYDVLIVGAGPAGLATAIHLRQLCRQAQVDYKVCMVEKGAEVGAHILSGAVFNPRALAALFPNYLELGAPLNTTVQHEQLVWLTAQRSIKLPIPKAMRNAGNYIISLANLCRWLKDQAEALGVEIYPGFAAAACVYDNNVVAGIKTNDFGLDSKHQPTATYQPGMELLAKYTVLAEGCRGSLSQQIIKKYKLSTTPQTYALGVKEIWQVDNNAHKDGLVQHTVGWPLDRHTYGGGFIYHWEQNKISIGMVVGLDYQNPSLDPFQELQRLKTHPAIKPYLQAGERIGYGAKSLTEGGWQAIPQLSFPGGVLVGCSAGFMHVPQLKGSHLAMHSGMLAAQQIFTALQQKDTRFSVPLRTYDVAVRRSWIATELYTARNVRPGFKYGLYCGMLYAAFDQYVLRGNAPWTLRHHYDHLQLKPLRQVNKIIYPQPDNKLTFDKLSSVYLTNTAHRENQPCHLVLTDPQLAIDVNWQDYGSPEQYYCPAAVYEILEQATKPRLQINAANCIHCKTCDIKDPRQNITWTTPEGGDGPRYEQM